MKAARVLQFGPPSVIAIDELPQPEPGSGELLARAKAAGVGPWDALVRQGKSELHQTLPLILGSELAGIVEALGSGVSGFKEGDEVYGALFVVMPAAEKQGLQAALYHVAHPVEGEEYANGDGSVPSSENLARRAL